MAYLHKEQKILTAVDEFDFAERLKPSAILEYFQDLATSHADDLGIGYERMCEKNMCWVLSRLRVVIDATPKLGDEISVTTYPHMPRSAETTRDYVATDTAGKTLFRGTSRWCALDISARRICRCASLFPYGADMYDPALAVPEGCPKVPSSAEIGCDVDRIVRDVAKITELDRNGHVNNARYADIVVNSCDFDFYATHSIAAFTFNFLSEMRVGTAYEVCVKTRDGVSYFEATTLNERKPIFRASVEWA